MRLVSFKKYQPSSSDTLLVDGLVGMGRRFGGVFQHLKSILEDYSDKIRDLENNFKADYQVSDVVLAPSNQNSDCVWLIGMIIHRYF